MHPLRRCSVAITFLVTGALCFIAGVLTGSGGLARLTDIKVFEGQSQWLPEFVAAGGVLKPTSSPAAPAVASASGASVAKNAAAGAAAAAEPAKAAAAAPPAETPAEKPAEKPEEPPAAEPPAAPKARRAKYGFYLHVFNDPAAVIFQVRELKKHFPESPVYIMSDGGLDYTPLCEEEGSCHAVLCPPANDRWHPWPFFRRLYDAAVYLNVEYVIMLEPDNTVHGPIKRPPDADAGGLYVKDRSFGMGDYVEKLASKFKPGFKWTRRSMQAGLAGGSYFKTEAILDAFSDESVSQIDWNYLGEKGSKEIYSSDFAMQFALAARGYNIQPWEETAQMDRKKDEPLTGPVDASFRHYCGCYPGGKPTYNIRLKPEDNHLFKQGPGKYRQYNYVCQLCYNLTRYKALWNTDECTNKIPFKYSDLLMERYHKEEKIQCKLTWLCDPKE